MKQIILAALAGAIVMMGLATLLLIAVAPQHAPHITHAYQIIKVCATAANGWDVDCDAVSVPQ